MKKVILMVLLILAVGNYGYASVMDEAIDEIPVQDFENYINNNNPYFGSNGINIKDLIVNAFKGTLDISLKD